jgi:hypothetical protein
MKSKDAYYSVRNQRTPPPSPAIGSGLLLNFPGSSQAPSRSAQSENIRNKNIIGYNFRTPHLPPPAHSSMKQTENIAPTAVIYFSDQGKPLSRSTTVQSQQ